MIMFSVARDIKSYGLSVIKYFDKNVVGSTLLELLYFGQTGSSPGKLHHWFSLAMIFFLFLKQQLNFCISHQAFLSPVHKWANA